MSWDVGAWVINTLRKLIENHGVQEFTSSGTFVVPAGVYKIYVTACGGGGGGGGCLYDSDSAYIAYDGNGGDGAAAIKRHPFSVVPGQEIAITIGTGGKAGSNSSSSPTAGSAGGSTVIGSLVTLAGGKGGGVKRASQKTTSNNIGGGIGGLGAYARRSYISGDYSTSTTSSEDGEYGIDNTKGHSRGGGGGGGSLGVGGNGASSSAKATNAGHGGGGGGAASERQSSTTFAATAGGNGYCLIEW